ncbi:hypothetical protein NQ317_003028 [Molorchus minor]|uniref:Tyr recombinase domain-containing protein n=1 Tax=Molorchus minor TaxID=1323400 RepID=A0ABQ9JH34_9CUCU|nr:hypothetical protein NQ317_003028 [Molorchus minor]
MSKRPISSRKRGRSPSRDRSVNGIYKLLKKIDCRLSAVERKQSKKQRARYNISDTDSESVTSASIRSRSRESSTERGRRLSSRDASETPTNEALDVQRLQEDILTILGSDQESKKSFSDPIQIDVARRWSHILTSGLDDTVQKALLEKYLPQRTVKIAVADSVIRRDTRLVALQQQVAASMSALGMVVTTLLSDPEANRDHIQQLSDAGRLLANIHHLESVSRRELIALNLNKNLKDTLTNTPISDLLFGTDLDNRLRAKKDLEKSGEQLKITKKANRPIAQASTSKSKPPITEIRSPEGGSRSIGLLRYQPAGSHNKLQEGIRKSLPKRPAASQLLEKPVSTPCGRLKYFIRHWRKLQVNRKILLYIKGLKIPFLKTPCQTVIPQENRWSQKEMSIIDQLVTKLLQGGAISPVDSCTGQFVSKIFTVPKPDGRYRLILNLKKLNYFVENSNFIPNQECTFLGFVYNSMSMTVSLPREKQTRMLTLLRHFSQISECTIREFAKFIGTLVMDGYTQKIFERQKYLALQQSNNNYDAKIRISKNLLNDIAWFIKTIPTAFHHMQITSFHLELFTDASRSGWGAFCRGKSTYGFWSTSEKEFHINYLELLALYFGLRCFASDFLNCNILCRVDNTTAVASVNRMGSVRFPTLNKITRRIWRWCEKRNIFLFASYINSKDNIEADVASRQVDKETEWSLSYYSFQKIVDTFGRPHIDLFASRLNKKCDIFISWMRDPEAFAVDAFTVNWGDKRFYAFPPFSMITRMFQKIIEDRAEGIVVVPCWASQPWYPIFKSLLVGDVVIFKPNRSLLSFNRTPHPLWQNLSLDKCQRFLRNWCQSSLSSITPGTLRQYNSGLKLWWEFCSTLNINPFLVRVTNVLEFLTIRFKNGASYGTLNSYRSAIAQIAGPDLGQDFRLKRFFKGIFGLRQPLPRYENTWDPGIVINYIRSLDNDFISLELLTQKLASLLALATGQRVQTLGLIEINNILVHIDRIEIKISRRIKTSAPKRSQPFLTLPFFHCGSTNKTKNLRGTCTFLFLTYRKPFHRATTQSISRWIKIILAKSGLDTSIFKAQSTRHASTSAAARKGINLDSIRLAAGWTKNSETFARFYNRPLVCNEQFANSVLSS